MRKEGALILAAGYGSRMNSDMPKPLFLFDGRPIISHIIERLVKLGRKEVIIVIGYKGEMIREYVEKEFADAKVNFIFLKQKLLRGSGRAVYESINQIKNYDNVLILPADVPVIKESSIKKLYKMFYKNNLDCVVLSCIVEDPGRYGRIIRDKENRIVAIREADELKDGEESINEINAGIYVFKTDVLIKSISRLKPKGSKKEYYLTDAIENIYKSGGRIDGIKIYDDIEARGPNSKVELVELERRYYLSNLKRYIDNGVIIKDRDSIRISSGVIISRDSVISNNVDIRGKSRIGKNVLIGPYVIIEDSIIEDECVINPFSYIIKSRIRKASSIGPFSHIRPQSDIGPMAKVGNFSEVKKSRIGRGSKVPHLSYVGDSLIGEMVNIGAGTITCNYDGKNKNKTIIGDRSFIGSNTNLIAPIKIGRDVVIGAGSTITDDVEDNKLAIARARQIVKERKR